MPLNDYSKQLKKENDNLLAKLDLLENRQMGRIEELVDRLSAVPPGRPSANGGRQSTNAGRQSANAGASRQGTGMYKGPLDSHTTPIKGAASNQLNADQEEYGDDVDVDTRGHNDMLYQKLTNLVERLEKNGQSDATAGPSGHPVQLAPTPLAGPYGNWNDMKEGYSHRFKTKIPVDVQEFYGEQGFDQQAALYEIASLQLHNIETMELLERKDKELQAADLEIQEFRKQMRESLLVQDELFKQYFVEKKIFMEKAKKLEVSNRNLTDRNEELEKDFQTLDQFLR